VPILVSNTPPVEPPPDPTPQFIDTPLLTWNGWNGDSWVLAGDLTAGTFIEQDGLGGILEPPVQHYFSDTTSDGSVWQGHRLERREVTVPLFVWADSPSAMRAEDARFRATLRPEKRGVLRISEPDGTHRDITLRYVAGAEGHFGSDTYGRFWMRHALTLVAEDPYFYGDEVSFEFSAAPASNFYGGTPGGFATPFVISSSQTIGSAAVFNPGTEPAFLQWRINGGMDTFIGGWGSNIINLPIALSSGDWLDVNSNPEWQTIVDQDGENRWADAGDVTFAPLPAGETTNLGLTIAGSNLDTLVRVTFRPKYRSAW
jgi:hypothetical protein